MIIIRLSGGLGNQMFLYALYLKLQSMGKEVKFDDVTEYRLANARPIMLWVFGISYQKASEEEIIKMTDASGKFFHKVKRKLFGRKSLEYREAQDAYDPQVFSLEHAYLCGCFQSERYFSDIKKNVGYAFSFREDLIRKEIFPGFLAYRQTIEENVSVSIHIRRGDYLSVDEVYGGICTEAYYAGAIRMMREKLENPCFFVFSNDTAWAEAWCRRQQEADSFCVVAGSTEETGYADLLLMSKCRHHVIANSSFSWWGAWLPKEEGRPSFVAAPAKWLNTGGCQDIYTEDMMLVDAAGALVLKGGGPDA